MASAAEVDAIIAAARSKITDTTRDHKEVMVQRTLERRAPEAIKKYRHFTRPEVTSMEELTAALGRHPDGAQPLDPTYLRNPHRKLQLRKP